MNYLEEIRNSLETQRLIRKLHNAIWFEHVEVARVAEKNLYKHIVSTFDPKSQGDFFSTIMLRVANAIDETWKAKDDPENKSNPLVGGSGSLIYFFDPEDIAEIASQHLSEEEVDSLYEYIESFRVI